MTSGTVQAAARAHSRLEITIDGIIHAIGIVAGAAGGGALLAIAMLRGGGAEITVSGIYLAGLLAMFGCSAAYNMMHWHHRRELLRNLDHSAIFLMIAGSYTPFTVLLLDGGWAVAMTAIVWSVAATGILMRLFLPRVFYYCRLALYLLLGWLGVVAAGPLMGVLDAPTMVLLAIGGIVYTLGVVFHVWTSLPFQNAIWHGFVLTGASLHYAAIVNGVLISTGRFDAIATLV